MRRLVARGVAPLAPLHALSPGELAALGWLVETLSQKDAVEEGAKRVLPLDFDAFLADVAGGMERVLEHFGLASDPACLAAVAGSAVLARYSKAPEVPFDPAERLARLAASRRDNRDEIARGMAWLERMARADAAMAAVHSVAAA
jgi:hypothetical protein